MKQLLQDRGHSSSKKVTLMYVLCEVRKKVREKSVKNNYIYSLTAENSYQMVKDFTSFS